MKYAFILMAAIYLVTFIGCSPDKQEVEQKPVAAVQQHVEKNDQEKKEDAVVDMRQQPNPTPLAAEKTIPEEKGVEAKEDKELSHLVESLRTENEQLKKELRKAHSETIHANKMRIALDLQLREASKHIRKQTEMLQNMRISNAAAEKLQKSQTVVEDKVENTTAGQAVSPKEAVTKGETQKIAQSQPAVSQALPPAKNNAAEENPKSFKPPIQPSTHKESSQKKATLEVEGKSESVPLKKETTTEEEETKGGAENHIEAQETKKLVPVEEE